MGIVLNRVGRNLWNQKDDLLYYAQPASGDVTVVAHVCGLRQSMPSWNKNAVAHDWSKSGIMLRSSATVDSAHYTLLLSGKNGVMPQARECDGCHTRWWGPSTQANVGAAEAWLKLEKRTNQLISYAGKENADGTIEWDMIHSVEFPNLGDDYYVGLASSSMHTYPLEVTFTDYNVEQCFFPSAAPSVSTTPTAFVASRDIGSPKAAGHSSLSSSGEYKVSGAGWDIWGHRDHFHYVNFPASGDVEVRFRVDSFSWVHWWQKGGIMIRDTLDDNAAHFSLLVTGSNRLGAFWRRAKGQHSSHWGGGKNDKPVWLKVVKVGNQFSAYYSYDGGDSYTLLKGPETVDFVSDTFEVGIAVTSHENDRVATLTGNDLVVEKPSPSARKLRGGGSS